MIATSKTLEGIELMNRLELQALLYSLDRMCKTKDYEGIKEVVEKLLEEAESEKKAEKKNQ